MIPNKTCSDFFLKINPKFFYIKNHKFTEDCCVFRKVGRIIPVLLENKRIFFPN